MILFAGHINPPFSFHFFAISVFSFVAFCASCEGGGKDIFLPCCDFQIQEQKTLGVFSSLHGDTYKGRHSSSSSTKQEQRKVFLKRTVKVDKSCYSKTLQLKKV